MNITANQTIRTILRHDSKVTSYKIALLRSINNTVTTFPDLRTYQQDVAVPLRLLAEFWVAYYWGFVDADRPIAQGQHSQRDGKTRNDMSFRPALSQFRALWEQHTGGLSNPADGFVASLSHLETLKQEAMVLNCTNRCHARFSLLWSPIAPVVSSN